jgi:hypothetical protein
MTAGVVLTAASLTGCNSASLLNKVEDFEPVAVDALNLYCAIRSSDPNCATLAAKIGADYTTVTQLWSAYLKALNAGTATNADWNAVNAAFALYEQDASQIFALIPQLNNPTANAIVAAAEVLLAAIEALFPGPPSGSASAKSAVFAAHADLMGYPSYNKAWLSSWASDFNQKVGVAQQQYPSAKLAKVKLHGKFM